MPEKGVFLQVRIASSRLAAKALLPLGDKPVIVHAMEALRSVPADQFWLVTDRESVSRLEKPARSCGFRVFAGDEHDVLKRFCEAADHTGVDIIVRATGDNPLVSGAVAGEALDLQSESGADYAGITGTPLGTGVEILRSAALRNLQARTTDPYEREHVSPGLYRDPARYRIVTRPVAEDLACPDFRVTLDTPEDYARLQRLYRDLYRGSPPDLRELVAYARRQLQRIA
ncbi:MAG: acylneuraminate cytidylyltransferase [Spirochaetaceae bacterium]|nr:MAG: acylneuraminate cytidylyltransferase [Spirochaetaceae bacterium]